VTREKGSKVSHFKKQRDGALGRRKEPLWLEFILGRKNLRTLGRGRYKRIFRFLVFVGMVLVIAGCATQPRPETYDPPGFFSGLLHGFLILFSFIGSWFWDVRIYAFPNSGGWYDFGYLIGASMFLGGGGASSR
jgi:hypothetical protein